VKQAQNSLRAASIPRIIFGAIRSHYADDTRAVRLDEKTGVGSTRVFRRKSGRPISEPVPALYTKSVFEEVTGKGAAGLIDQFNEDRWVLGETTPAVGGTTELFNQVLDVYEAEYIATWDRILADFDAKFDSAGTAEALAILGGPTSPLRSLYQTVTAETNFTKAAPAGAPKPGLIARTTDQIEKLVRTTQQAAGITARDPGARITAHFAEIHRVVAGEPGNTELDRLLGTLQKLQQEIGTGPGQLGGGGGNVTGANNPQREQLVRSLQAEAEALPPAVGGLVADIANSAAGAFRTGLRSELQTLYQQDVVLQCRDIVNNKYPFVRESQISVTPEDFGELFGYDGIFDRFFKKNMEQLVNMVSRPWSWRKDATGAQVGGTEAMLRQFETAQRIRDMYFPNGARKPEVRFGIAVTELDTGAAKVTLEIGGNRVDYQFGAPRSLNVTWPGSEPGQAAALVFTDKSARPTPIAESGPWAWLRLIEAGQVTERSDTEYTVTWQRGPRSATAEIRAVSRQNPFNKSDVQNFRCG
jgi:type VI secretion system protein ImpL